ncbi:4Fe-4S binding protein [Aidingimonas lacisalsi]|uniref:4Fe-4S binding protein n=1 Tax=Aidingimonas lacisalsi TaxID=2604086 RepID=UPI0011D27F60|nr:4Fe-4S binding protein [Aidingimonas lacisalsi]
MDQRIIGAAVLDAGANTQARDTAMQQVSWPVNLTPASVEYQSRGNLLIIGTHDDCVAAADSLQGDGLASVTLLAYGERRDTEAVDASTWHIAQEQQSIEIQGYLGAFDVWLDHPDGPINLAKAAIGHPHFDLILDLGASPRLDLELNPPGYFACHWRTTEAENALQAIPEHIGIFEKPRYFQIDHDRCAHDSSGHTGCTRCLTVCPADAIRERQQRIESWIEIDPYRCQGAGSCTSVCPTGAIQYRLPQPQQQHDYIGRMLTRYRQAGGGQPVVRFIEAAHRQREAFPTPGHLLDVPLDELGAGGMEHWLGALVAGACEVRIHCHDALPASIVTMLEDQWEQTRALLAALGHSPERMQMLREDDQEARDALPHHSDTLDTGHASTEATILSQISRSSEKRDRLNTILEWLETRGTVDGERHPLPGDAPFGGLVVDDQACTLCMSCVAACPTPALASGESTPQLHFREADCVQCGLCASACPEDAIRLTPGFLSAPERHQRHIKHEEPPFECISCGKPFATISTIETIKAKLADHPYFAGDAMARLEMCEDCRVKDVWRDMAKNPESQLKV